MSEELKKTDIKKIAVRGCLIVAGILFLIFLCRYNQIKKESLYDTEGRTFAKATVMNVLQDNETKDGIYIGRQLVKLKITSGKWKGKTMEADSSSAYLYGAHCKKGSKVIALVSEANGSFSASVYSVDREMQVYLIIAIFLLTLIIIGGKQGLASVIGLAFTAICILFLFLPMIYKGHSPILSAVLVVALTTIVTMYLVGGVSGKTAVAIIGTISGVLISALFAFLFCKMTDISGYNVSSIREPYLCKRPDGNRRRPAFICGNFNCIIRSSHGCSNVHFFNNRRNIPPESRIRSKRFVSFMNACWKRYDGNHGQIH